MEPDWMKSISNTTICNFFYIFFIAYAIMAAAFVLGGIWVMATIKLPKGMDVVAGLMYVGMLAIVITELLFLYLICDRALIATSASSTAQ